MKTLLITYSLKFPLNNTATISNIIKRFQKWWHYLPNVWIVRSELTPEAVRKSMDPFINKGDRIFIVELKNNCNGWLPPDAWKWLSENLQNY